MQTYEEQLAAFEAKRAANVARQKELMDAAATEGATLDEAGQEEFDELGGDNEAIDKHIKRLNTLIAETKRKAVPADGSNADTAGASRGGQVIVKTQPKLENGMEFARLIKCLGMTKGDMGMAVRVAEARYGENSNAAGTLKAIAMRGDSRLEYSGGMEKATVGSGSTASGNWAADLVLDEGGAFSDFANYLRPKTILGQFGTGGIPSLRQVPFRTALGISTSGGAGYWVGEGLGKPLTSFNVDKTFLEPLKCANIVVLTEELLRSASYSAEVLVRDEMVGALVGLIDSAFIDPTNSGTSNVKPAAIAYGAQAIAAESYSDADDIRLDIRSLLQRFINANNEGTAVVLVMRTGDALAAGMIMNALGQPEFPNIGITGGSLMPGLPVITSQSVPSGYVIAVQLSEIYYADEGGFMVDVSREASLLMTNDANSNMSSLTPTAASLVSMFQTNSVAFRAERILNWSRRRSSAVAYLTGVAWGGPVNSS